MRDSWAGINRRVVLGGLGSVAATAFARGADAADGAITEKGLALAHFLDGLGVESRWIVGQRIDWRTGLPNGKSETHPGKHTHCSAFVASAAEQLGVYILRPPEHIQQLLANAQFDWLAGVGGSPSGWGLIPDAAAAQAAANQGRLVVAVYHNHHDDRPGHIAIVRPSDKSAEAIAADGPEIIQAGGHNYTSTTLRQGFASHPAAWGKQEVRFYAHDIELSAKQRGNQNRL